MTITLQPLPFDANSLQGLSQRLLSSHHQNNYGGGVKRLNAIRDQLRAADLTLMPGYQLNGLKREELMAANSVRLHELYFNSLSSDVARAMVPAMQLALDSSFGSVERWHNEFVGMGKALAGGSGWVVLCFDPQGGHLINQWAGDHSQALVHAVPLLALDMYEHAYHLDFGAAAGDYVAAFMKHLDWAKVYARYQHAVHAHSETLAACADDIQDSLLFDVRRRMVFEASESMLPGAEWRDPAHVDRWGQAIPRDRNVIVYCIYGHEVGRSTAMRLQAQGVSARFLSGGIDGWTSSGHPVVTKGQEKP